MPFFTCLPIWSNGGFGGCRLRAESVAWISRPPEFGRWPVEEIGGATDTDQRIGESAPRHTVPVAADRA